MTYQIKMTSILISFFMLFSACNQEVKTLGKKFTENKPISIDSLLSQTKSSGHVEAAQVEGAIFKSCRSEGCWFTIKDKSGQEVLLEIKDKHFKMPLNSPERQAVALVNADTSADSDNGVSIDVKGIMFK